MDIIWAVSTFAGVSVFLVWLAKKAEKKNYTYETAFCRDVRAELGMFVYRSAIEEARERLIRKDTKF